MLVAVTGMQREARLLRGRCEAIVAGSNNATLEAKIQAAIERGVRSLLSFGVCGALSPVLAKKLSAFEGANKADPVCGSALWQRDPFRVTFNPSGMEAVSFEIVPGSAVLVEDSEDAAEAAVPIKAN